MAFTSHLLVVHRNIIIIISISVTMVTSSEDDSCSRYCRYVSWARDADCSGRGLRAIPQECSGAKVLNLNRNNITEVHPGEFSAFKYLKYLQVLETNVVRISEFSFAGASRLKCINFHGNQLQLLPAHAFNDTVSLRLVYLSHNQIASIAQGVFQESPRIEVLYLDFNHLDHLEGEVFKGLADVQRLLLGDNRLEVLPEGIFSDLESLNYLDLSSNRLQVLDPDTFKGLANLQALKISGNKLVQIMSGTFSHINVLSLNISNNGLSSLDWTVGEFGDIEEMDASGNPWSCDCSLEPFRVALEGILGERDTTCRCASPASMAQKPIVSVTHLCPSIPTPLPTTLDTLWSVTELPQASPYIKHNIVNTRHPPEVITLLAVSSVMILTITYMVAFILVIVRRKSRQKSSSESGIQSETCEVSCGKEDTTPKPEYV